MLTRAQLIKRAADIRQWLQTLKDDHVLTSCDRLTLLAAFTQVNEFLQKEQAAIDVLIGSEGLHGKNL